MQISMKVSYKLILWFLVGMVKLPKIINSQCFYNISKKAGDEVDFLHADKHESLLHVYTNILGVFIQTSQSIHSSSIWFVVMQQRVTILNLGKNAVKCSSVAAAFVFYCDAKNFDILRGSSHVRCFLFYIILYYLKE